MHVVIFLTYGNSLKDWDSAGILEREVKIYKELSKLYNFKFTFITFGDESDYKYKDTLKNIEIIPIYSKFKNYNNKILKFLYSFIIANRLSNFVTQVNLIKTNQLMGSWMAIVLKIKLKSALLIRTGYDHLYFAIKNNKSYLKRILIYLLTQVAILYSTKYSVTSKADEKFICKYFYFTKNKIIIRPNWVEISDSIEPINKRYDDRIISVGRLEHQKNFSYLINELKDTEINLDIIGEGSQYNELKTLSYNLGVKLSLLNKISNEELLSKISKYKIFSLSSHFEGSPKVLLEAMSKGCVPVVSDISHHKEIINNNLNGLVLELSENNFKENILKLLTDEKKLNLLSSNAINTIKETYSFESYVKNENSDYLNIISN